MLVLFCLLLCRYFGDLWARQLDIDINRVKLLSNEVFYPRPYENKGSNSLEYQYKRSNDYTDNSSRLPRRSETVQSVHDATSDATSTQTAVHQPREDPQLFYQSASYLQEISRKNISRPVSAIYPGREVVRAGDAYTQPMPLLARDVSYSRISLVRNWCIPPTPPDNGYLGCKGTTVGGGTGYAEGSICRISCSQELHLTPRAGSVCHRGKWTYKLSCQPKMENQLRNK